GGGTGGEAGGSGGIGRAGAFGGTLDLRGPADREAVKVEQRAAAKGRVTRGLVGLGQLSERAKVDAGRRVDHELPVEERRAVVVEDLARLGGVADGRRKRRRAGGSGRARGVDEEAGQVWFDLAREGAHRLRVLVPPAVV